jgi:hypothetical protein
MSFVPADVRIPGVYPRVQLQKEVGLLALPRKVLLIGWRLSSAPSTFDLIPRRVRTRGEVQAAAGAGSALDLMARAAFACGPLARRDRETGSLPEIWVMAVPPASGMGTATATQTSTFAGPATANGTITGYLGSEVVSFTVASGDTADDIAAAARAASQRAEPNLTHTSTVTDEVVTHTAREPGVWGEDLVIYWDVSQAPGVTVTVARGTTGAGVVDLSDALDAALATDWTIVVLPQDDAATLATLPVHVDAAWDFTRQRYAAYCLGARGDLSDAETVAGELDDWRIIAANAEQVPGEGGVPFAFARSARAFSFEAAAAIGSRLLTQRRVSYNFNRATLPVLGRPSSVDTGAINDAINAGVSVVLEPAPGATSIVVDPVTTAVTDQTGATNLPDATWQPVEIVLTTASVVRQVTIALTGYEQRDADEDTLADARSATLAVLRAFELDERALGEVDDSDVAVKYVAVGAATHLVVDLQFRVKTGIDIVAVTHQVRRAI